MGAFGSGIKSKQAFVITVSENDATDTATLGTAVVVANSHIVTNGKESGSGANAPNDSEFSYVLTDTTTVTVTRSTAPASGDSAVVRGYVIENYM